MVAATRPESIHHRRRWWPNKGLKLTSGGMATVEHRSQLSPMFVRRFASPERPRGYRAGSLGVMVWMPGSLRSC